jgi:hypothetical protein
VAGAQVALLKAPFPWFGGKSRVAPEVWDRFGDVDNYVEPFAGSLAVLLGRPTPPQTETVNDLDCYLANFWRSLRYDPEGVTEAADWPVNEADLHARHRWLVNQDQFRERMKTDPLFFDARIAGWWVWGISQWIGSGWCSRPEWTGRVNAGRESRGINRKLPSVGDGGRGVFRGITGTERKRPMIHGGHHGKGVHAAEPGIASQFGTAQQIPHLATDGMGINRLGIEEAEVSQKRPILSGHGPGIGIHGDAAYSSLRWYMEALSERLRRVRVCCGDWTRVLGPSVTVKHGVCGVFLDPPYDMRVVSNPGSQRDGAAPSDGLYSSHDNDLSAAVRAWAIEQGDNPLLRIALCGYEAEHEMPRSWECFAWKAHGGYGSQRGDRGYENAARERIWFSPHCLRPQESLFRDL